MNANTIDPDDAAQHGETERGECFDRVTVRAPFSGPFDAAAIHKAVAPEWGVSLYNPVSVPRASVREIAPGIAEWVRVLSNGD